jgi:maltooligosyltrehalose trehalohydrolase
MSEGSRRYPVGAELTSSREADVRVWAPSHSSLQLRMDDRLTQMCPDGRGYFTARVPACAGSRYGFLVPGDDRLYADPASRSQPDGPEGPSEVIDLTEYGWTDASWPGIALPGQVVYELHVGTFTGEGTWRAAEAELPRLRDTGITVVQVMPIGEFAGEFGWGYDGVLWFAPFHGYGRPADLQHFVDAAHRIGLAVILDVVYNHLGPAGNFLSQFSPQYFTDRYVNEWGEAVNFDGEGSAATRELVVSNAAYWIREFHLDGFRIDAAQQIHDSSPEHILEAVARTAREAAAPRSIVVLAEHEPQHARLLRPPGQGGYGLDGIYNEDFHHSMRVALTGVRESYLSDYTGSSEEWLAALQWGFLFQGQYYPWQSNPRGAPALDRPPQQFVCFIENHDQVANTTTARRLIDLASPAWWRAISALLLLGPWTPLIFQGQEWGSRRPFQYFTDHRPELQAAIHDGRRRFLSQFTRQRAQTAPSASDSIGREAFEASRLGRPAAPAELAVQRMYRDLLALRRDDRGLGQHARMTGATAGDRTLILRSIAEHGGDERLLVVNLGPDLDLAAQALPLVAPPAGHHWQGLWCSQDLCYGGSGIAGSQPPSRLIATGHATAVFAARAT